MHIEIYAANLRHGGAVVTASSLLEGLIEVIQGGNFSWIDRLDLIISPDVATNLTHVALSDPTSRIRLSIRDDKPGRALFKASNPSIDIRFAVFGPEYVRSRARVNVVGFADGTLIPSWELGRPEPQRSRNLTFAMRNAFKKWILGRYDAYVVQTDGMANALAERYPGKIVAVLPNLLGPPFLHPEHRETHVLPPRQPNEARFFYPAKGYPHKNHQILAEVSHHYRQRFGQRLSFVITLTPAESSGVIPPDCPDILNIGPIPAKALPSLYEQTDGLFFPSLNETFSVAPLEAAFMRKPIIASSKQFAHETLGNLATYFDPEDPLDAAIQTRLVVNQSREESHELQRTLDSAQNWASQHSDPSRLGSELLEFFRSVELKQT